ncbi:hypothetical protein KY312_01145, partial [Candidatus Woesearchaeota archaeon]|nr:hypothetical protein [Candidatus Woesearchaeota archaeon]
KSKAKNKKYLILTGASASGVLAGSILHNLFYALAIVAENITVLKHVMEALHVIFFFASLIVCPILFIAGAVLSIIKK